MKMQIEWHRCIGHQHMLFSFKGHTKLRVMLVLGHECLLRDIMSYCFGSTNLDLIFSHLNLRFMLIHASDKEQKVDFMFDYVKIEITGHLNIKGRAIRQLRNLIILGNCRASCVLVSRDIYPKLLQPCYLFCICRTSPCASDLLFHFQCSRSLLYKHRDFDINQHKLSSKPLFLSSSILQSFPSRHPF